MKQLAHVFTKWPVITDIDEGSEGNTKHYKYEIRDGQIEDVAGCLVFQFFARDGDENDETVADDSEHAQAEPEENETDSELHEIENIIAVIKDPTVVRLIQ